MIIGNVSWILRKNGERTAGRQKSLSIEVFDESRDGQRMISTVVQAMYYRVQWCEVHSRSFSTGIPTSTGGFGRD